MSILCPSEMPSCTEKFKHSFTLNQSATVSKDTAETPAIAADHEPPHEHFNASNYIGFILVTTMIIVGLSLWGILSFQARRRERKRGEGEMGDKQKAEKMAEKWLKVREAKTRSEQRKYLTLCS